MLSSALIFTVVGTGEASYTGDGEVARRAGLNQPFDVAWTGRAISTSRTRIITVCAASNAAAA
jgi:hypothetical protein